MHRRAENASRLQSREIFPSRDAANEDTMAITGGCEAAGQTIVREDRAGRHAAAPAQWIREIRSRECASRRCGSALARSRQRLARFIGQGGGGGGGRDPNAARMAEGPRPSEARRLPMFARANHRERAPLTAGN